MKLRKFFKLNDMVYKILKWTAIIALPTAEWTIGELANVYGFDGFKATKTISIIATAIGIIIFASSVAYNKSQTESDHEEEL